MAEVREVIKKICLLGDPAVGKTSLIRRYVFDMFDDKYITTIGTKVTKKTVMVAPTGASGGVKITLLIWDILGQREYQRLHPVYYQGAEGALIVCDSTRKETIGSLATWVTSFKNVVGQVPVVFLMNKSDLVDQARLDRTEIENLSRQHSAPYLPTSAKTGLNVERAFVTVSEALARLLAGS
ncbi:MAG: GTP-binding protein [Euryarchaeota archaeon]|nr:GTP-binding protein [Euryarchaeota archaeon]